MRVLFGWPVSEMSVWDVARGYRSALARVIGEENIRDYWLNTRTQYHQRAMGINADHIRVAQYASEGMLNEAMYFEADVVFMVSILNVHPITLWALRKAGIHVAVLMTESPYDDLNQADMVSTYPEATVFTHEETSAHKYGWKYLRHAYDPAVHHPVEPDFADHCDVLMVGTGWADRQALLEAVDWTGIDLRLYGIWPMMTVDSPLYDKMWPVCVDNRLLPSMYSGAKICLNLHRSHADAVSLNPRAFEIAACGGFQISDHRRDVPKLFGESVPTFRDAIELETLVHQYLADGATRYALAMESRLSIVRDTFDVRTEFVMDALRHDLQARRAA